MMVWLNLSGPFMNLKLTVLVSALGLLVLFFLLTDPIAQSLAYHQFSDQNRWLGVPNFWNVLSNLPFFLAGGLGMSSLAKRKLNIKNDTRMMYWVFFSGVFLVGFGSSWYHLNPNNQTLLWDRLPMTLAFMAFFAIIITEHVDRKLGRLWFKPLVGIGITSIVYWQYTESLGQGDLRLYGLVQFLPLLLIPLIFWLRPKPYSHIHLMWWFLAWYVIAKILETFDPQIFTALRIISGHSLKHVAAALGVLVYWRCLQLRKANAQSQLNSDQ